MPKRLLSIVISLSLLISAGVAYTAYLKRPFGHRVSGFVTDLQARTPAQRHNILQAATQIDGLVLHPGKTLSFNQVAGPYTQAQGFLPERTFMRGQSVMSSGGGVCQVSSTLYNAAKLAGLEIIERTPHTQTIESVPPGWDATLAYGVSDLKLRNPHDYPLRIQVRETQNQLLIEIWGKGDSS